MPVKFVAGDLLVDEGIVNIAHGCNTKGAMGAGIAKDIKRLFPNNYSNYKIWCDNKFFKSGICLTGHENGKYIHNLGTQEDFGEAKLEFIEKSLMKMVGHANNNKETKIGMPRIGAGLGGLEWEDVKNLIKKIADSPEAAGIEFIVFEDFVKGQKNYTEKPEFDQDLLELEKTTLIKSGFDSQKQWAKHGKTPETLMALVYIATDIGFEEGGGSKLIQALAENKHLPKEAFEPLLSYMHDMVEHRDCAEPVKDRVSEIVDILEKHPTLPKGLIQEIFGEDEQQQASNVDSEDFIKSLTPENISKSDDSPLLFKLASSNSGIYTDFLYRRSSIKRFCELNQNFEDIYNLLKELYKNKIPYIIFTIDNISDINILLKIKEDVEKENTFNFTKNIIGYLNDVIISMISSKKESKQSEPSENQLFDGVGKVNAQSVKEALQIIVKYASILEGTEGKWIHPATAEVLEKIDVKAAIEEIKRLDLEKNSKPYLSPIDKEDPPTHYVYDNWREMFHSIKSYVAEISGNVCGVGRIDDPEICFMVYPHNSDLAKTNDKAKCFKISRENFEKTYDNSFTYYYAKFWKHQLSSLEGQWFMCKLFAGEIKSEELEKEVNAYKESIDELSKQSIESAIQSIESIKTKESESKPMSNPVSSLIVPDLLKQAGVRIACETTSAATKDLIVKILKDRGADDFIISTVAEYIDTPIGQSAISLVYAFGLPQAKRIEFFNKNSEMVDAVVKEFQIQAATKSGKVALEALKNLFLPVIQQALALMSSDEEQAQESSEKQQSQVA